MQRQSSLPRNLAEIPMLHQNERAVNVSAFIPLHARELLWSRLFGDLNLFVSPLGHVVVPLWRIH